MPKRCANIHKRKDDRWEGRIKVGNYPNGATKYHSIYRKTYSEVKDKLDEFKQSKLPAKHSRISSHTFDQIASMWLSSVKISIKQPTVYRYEYLIERHIIPELGRLPITDITSATVNTFLDKKLKSGRLNGKGGLSPAYVKAMADIIKSVVTYAATEDFCLPLKTKISMPTAEKAEVPILTCQEQQQLQKYINTNMDLTGLGIFLSLFAGLRIGEVCALTWDDIDLELGVIHVRHTVVRVKYNDESGNKGTCLALDKPKTKASQRDIPITSFLMPYLITAQKKQLQILWYLKNHNFLVRGLMNTDIIRLCRRAS